MVVPTDERPLLLLDVDGVLNPYASAACPDGFEELDVFPDDDPPLRVDRRHGPWLRELAECFEIVWATAWGEEANRVLGPLLGLPRFPVIGFPTVPFEPREKVPAVSAFAKGRAAAWVDDALTPEAHAWAATRETPTLLVDVDPAIGLTRAVIDRLSGWCAAPHRSFDR